MMDVIRRLRCSVWAGHFVFSMQPTGSIQSYHTGLDGCLRFLESYKPADNLICLPLQRYDKFPAVCLRQQNLEVTLHFKHQDSCLIIMRMSLNDFDKSTSYMVTNQYILFLVS